MLEWMKSTLPNSLNLVVHEFKQECPTGIFRRKGWELTTRKKIKLFLQLSEKEELFLAGDVDLQFFRDPIPDVIEQLGDYDLAAQKDETMLCTGFFICRGNTRTQNLFKLSLKRFYSQRGWVGDQPIINKNRHLAKTKQLDYKYWSIWRTRKQNSWKSGNFKVPKDIIMHHANFVLKDEKLPLMKMVREKINAD